MSKIHWWCGIFKEWQRRECKHSLCKEMRSNDYTGSDWRREF